MAGIEWFSTLGTGVVVSDTSGEAAKPQFFAAMCHLTADEDVL